MPPPSPDVPPLRRHQREALDVLTDAWEQGRTRTWVVLPPGAGKTRLGLEAVRRVPGIERSVVFGPNTAIQAQWEQQAHGLGIDAGTDRDLSHVFTALTYQSLAVFDADEEVDDEGEETSLLAKLHDNGRDLVARLRAAGPILIVLDECHHLLEVWGRLLEELLDELPQAWVVGLTATPPDALTLEQAALVDALFGHSAYQTSIPAVVREGDLAPFAEMVWMTTPTEVERDWLRSQAQRFEELVTQLLDPTFGSAGSGGSDTGSGGSGGMGFLTWLDLRFVQDDLSWTQLQRRHPMLCDAALRMHHRGLLALPTGARPGEQHRHDPTPDDWVALIEDWLERGLARTDGSAARADGTRTDGTSDEAHRVRDAVRRALPSVGFQLTRRGIRRGRTPVDRVLARSAAKMRAAVDIAVHEHAVLGERMRCLVLCDHERASAMLPADLRGVLDQQSGSAHAVLAGLVADPATAALSPIMVTGRTVAGAPETLARLRMYAAEAGLRRADELVIELADGAGGVALLSGPTGSWNSRTWVPHVTGFFQAGHCQILVGTRALLGEGWDATRITGLVDLTAVTTTTAVVQTRGRALRVDSTWPDKVALNWSVVCVADEHPKAHNDWDRLVRKHHGFLAVDDDGDVVDGVAHIDPALSPYAPPDIAEFDAVNARMLVRAQDRTAIRDRWRVGEPYDDVLGQTLRITAAPRTLSEVSHAPEVVPGAELLDVRPTVPPREVSKPMLVVALLAAVLAVVGGTWELWPLLPLAAVLGALAWWLNDRRTTAYGERLLRLAAQPPGVGQVARAVADGLSNAGLVSVGADGVRVDIDHDGRYRCHLDGVGEAESAVFTASLDEVISPIVNPRYVVPRWVVAPGPVSRRTALSAARRVVQPDGVVWHTVPTVLGRRARDAQRFAAAWRHWVGGGEPLFTRSPEGAGILAAQAGADPFEATTVMRRHWS